MATELSPQRLREAQFAEVWRGYRMDQVRELLDDAADVLEDLRNRARDAEERAAVAERRLVERVAGDEVSRTLVLAQRTADSAISEAQAEAGRLVGDAEQRSRAMLGDAEQRSRAMLGEVERRAEQLEREMEARAEAALRELSDRRAALEADVALLADYVERQRGTLADELRQLLSWLDRGGHLDAPPVALTGAVASALGGGTTGTAQASAAPSAAAPDHGADAPPVPLSEAPEPFVAGESPAPGDARHVGEDSEADGPSGGPALVDVHGDEPPSKPTGSNGTAGDEGESDADTAGGSASSDSEVAGVIDDDPFLAELRRAVDDPEPLGPRDDDPVWAEGAELYDQDITGSGRFRRRRR